MEYWFFYYADISIVGDDLSFVDMRQGQVLPEDYFFLFKDREDYELSM